MTDFDRIKSILRALQAKTTAAGCTEEEALAAAEKLAELLTKYNLSHDDLAAPDGWGQEEVSLGARRRPRDDLWGAVAYYCDCKSWFHRTSNARWKGVYFGRAAHVAVAIYLHELLDRAITDALERYKEDPAYQRRRKVSTRRAALKAFEVGMVDRLRLRLGRLKWLRYRTPDDEQTKALLVAYCAPIEAELAQRGMELKKLPDLEHKTRRDAAADRFAGRIAAEGVGLNAGVGAASSAPAGLLGMG